MSNVTVNHNKNKDTSLRVCHVVYSFYESDTRVRMYAEALAERGDRVEVVSLRKPGMNKHEIINGVEVHRIQKRVVNEHSRWEYLSRILRFFFLTTFFLSRKSLRRHTRFDVVHVHSVPDFEVFAAIVPKILGARVILDIHDLVPEFYAGKFGFNKESITFKALLFVEKISVAFADHVITANHLWEKVIKNRALQRNKCSTFLNYPVPAFFQEYPKTRHDGTIRLIYPGTLNYHQGVDIAVRALDLIKNAAPEAEFHIYGEGPNKTFLESLVKDLALSERVLIRDFLPIEKIIPIIANADIGVVPKRADGFGDTAFSTKILEFMALGVPVIVAKTTIDSFYFNDAIVQFFSPGNVESLAKAMIELVLSKKRRKFIANKAKEYVLDNSWEKKKYHYLKLIDEIVNE